MDESQGIPETQQNDRENRGCTKLGEDASQRQRTHYFRFLDALFPPGGFTQKGVREEEQAHESGHRSKQLKERRHSWSNVQGKRPVRPILKSAHGSAIEEYAYVSRPRKLGVIYRPAQALMRRHQIYCTAAHRLRLQGSANDQQVLWQRSWIAKEQHFGRDAISGSHRRGGNCHHSCHWNAAADAKRDCSSHRVTGDYRSSRICHSSCNQAG